MSKKPTELRYIESSVFKKKLNNQNLWNFELGNHKSMNIPISRDIGIQKRVRQDSPDLNSDTFCRLPVVSAQCVLDSEKFADAGISLKNDNDD